MYYKNNVPRFGFRTIRLLVYYVQNKKTETLAVARDFTFFTGRSNGSETFAHYLCTNFSNFQIYFIIVGVT